MPLLPRADRVRVEHQAVAGLHVMHGAGGGGKAGTGGCPGQTDNRCQDLSVTPAFEYRGRV